MRPVASSVAQFVENATGYLPAPILYGVVNEMTGGEKSRYGMIMLSLWTLWAVVFMSYAYWKQGKKRKEAKLQKQKEL